MHIVVLCGGLCPERDVSIVSGRQIAERLTERGHKVLLLDLFFGYTKPYINPLDLFDGSLDNVPAHLGKAAPDLGVVAAQRTCDIDGPIGKNVLALCRAADIVFMALHGAEGENGKLQALFDMLHIRYTGTGYMGSALAMHKGMSRTLFAHAGIHIAPGVVIERRDGQSALAIWHQFPCVVKPNSGGSSVAVSIVYTPDEFVSALDAVFALGDDALVEAFIAGREFSVGVLGVHALPVIEICPRDGFYDYQNKYQKGMADEICPADLPDADTQRMQQFALAAHHALGLSVYSRSDFMLSDTGTIYCLETNTLPGMTPTSLLPQEAAAIGLDFADLCEKILALSMEKYQ